MIILVKFNYSRSRLQISKKKKKKNRKREIEMGYECGQWNSEIKLISGDFYNDNAVAPEEGRAIKESRVINDHLPLHSLSKCMPSTIK